MSVSSPVLILILAAYARIATVGSLKCAQCTSKHTRNCKTGAVKAQECTGLYQGAHFCVTYSGTIRSGRVVFRDCSYVDMKSICRSQLLENYETEVCYETCDTDGCNTVPSSSTTLHSKLSSVMTLLYLICSRVT